jgi:putative ABC transport system ATP-binding protein
MTNPFIEARGVKKAYPIPGGEMFWALKGIDIQIPQGKLTILKGRSGSGKTTLMNMLGALDDVTEGEIFFDGKEITKMPEKDRTILRRKTIGFVFQSIALIPIMTAQENVEYSLRLAGWEGNYSERAARCLDMVGLLKRASHMPQELSGGEQQRVAIARAFAHSPRIMFADEPTGELDTGTALKVVKIFKELNEIENVTIVMTTHDKGFMEIGDSAYEMEDGEITSGS